MKNFVIPRDITFGVLEKVVRKVELYVERAKEGISLLWSELRQLNVVVYFTWLTSARQSVGLWEQIGIQSEANDIVSKFFCCMSQWLLRGFHIFYKTFIFPSRLPRVPPRSTLFHHRSFALPRTQASTRLPRVCPRTTVFYCVFSIFP